MPRAPGRLTGLWAQVAFYSSLGFILPAGAVCGFIVGWLLDRWLHTSPALAIIMSLAGIVGGLLEVLRILTRTEKNGEGNDSSRRTGSC